MVAIDKNTSFPIIYNRTKKLAIKKFGTLSAFCRAAKKPAIRMSQLKSWYKSGEVDKNNLRKEIIKLYRFADKYKGVLPEMSEELLHKIDYAIRVKYKNYKKFAEQTPEFSYSFLIMLSSGGVTKITNKVKKLLRHLEIEINGGN